MFQLKRDVRSGGVSLASRRSSSKNTSVQIELHVRILLALGAVVVRSSFDAGIDASAV